MRPCWIILVLHVFTCHRALAKKNKKQLKTIFMHTCILLELSLTFITTMLCLVPVSAPISLIVSAAKCGPIPLLANSEVVWHNRSVVIHRCAPGYHSWRGSNTSVCGNSGLWLQATLTCIGEYQHEAAKCLKLWKKKRRKNVLLHIS